MARTGIISGVAGVLVAAGVFVVLQAWTPPNFLLDVLDAAPTRKPSPERPLHTLAVRPEPATGAAAIVTETDVVNARPRPAPADGPAGVTLELSGEAADRLAAYAKSHAHETLAVTVDNTLIYTKPAAGFTGDGARAIDLRAQSPLEDSNTRLAARFGGAYQPPPGYALAAARLAPALIAGLVVLFLIRLLTTR
jgi:hypothetical protein